MLNARLAITKIFSSVLYLAKQSLALRGHHNDRSYLMQLLKARAEDIPQLNNWLNRTGHKWLHNEIVNEIIYLLADSILQKIIGEIKNAKYFSLMLDETSDVSRLEQVSICLRVSTDNMIVSNYFMGFRNTGDTKAETLLALVTEFLNKNSLNIHDLRGQCYDGARNVSGNISGLQRRIINIEPRALFVHCCANSLNSVVQDTLEDLDFARSFIGLAKEVIYFIRDSPKRLHEFKKMQEEYTKNAVNLSPYCPTRYFSLLFLKTFFF